MAHSAMIKTLIGIRKAQGIGQTSTVAIQTCNTSLYSAIIDGKGAMSNWSGCMVSVRHRLDFKMERNKRRCLDKIKYAN